LELSSIEIWGNSNDASIAFLRHSEVKHGRVAMAAFVGYIVQSNGIHWPWPMTTAGDPFPYAAGSPPEQWDALPDVAKWQIIVFIGFLEQFSESQGKHYMRGGVPGMFPKFTDYPAGIPHPVPFNLYDPFGFHKNRSEEAKARGRISEINNGRLAQIGILGFLSEQKLAGSVPLLAGIVPPYAGEPMAPFG
jgi:Chlorophyll A-B binding protein